MADAVLTVALTQLATILQSEIEQEVRLVTGAERDVDKLGSTLQAIVGVIADAEKRQLKEDAVKDWLEKLKDAAYDVDDLLTEWSTAMLRLQIERSEGASQGAKKKVWSFFAFPCFCFSQVSLRRDIALRIKQLNERLDEIALEKVRYRFNIVPAVEEPQRLRTVSCVDPSKIRGRDQDREALVGKLLGESSQAERGLHIVSVVGMGGIGKTTLAQLAYNSEEVKAHFQIRIWVCVSEPFDDIRVAKAIVEHVEGNALNFFELEAALRHVSNCIAGKKFLLVLDDVWNEDYKKWEPLENSLKNGARGSKILVTTRNEKVAKLMQTTKPLYLGQLSDNDCWLLFSHMAFSGGRRDEQLETVGRKIANKCKGFPLAAKTIGSLMRLKNTLQDWQNVLDSETWELEMAGAELFPPLLLSYYDLTPAMKRCFSYCSVFPKDHKIETENLIQLWMAQGYLRSRGTEEMETTGQEYIQNLVMRSFFQDLEKEKKSDAITRFKMHDVVHDFAQFLTKNECFIAEVGIGTEVRLNSTCPKARHSTLVRIDEAPFPASVYNTEKLHTFWVQSFYDSPPIVSENEIDRIQPDLFNRLTCLKALDLSRNRLRELPEEVGKLINLRYLNLSHNPLEELPELVCDLCNLQTLKLVACDHLVKLPQGMRKLINLRHLEIDRTDRLRMLPKGIGRLSSLRTLSKFVIGHGGEIEEVACKLAELKDLNCLQGNLDIEGLGYIADAGEAERAELKNKRHLLSLNLDFSLLVAAERATDVFKGLQLHPNLQFLQIKLYGGTQLPGWMVSLTNLRKLQLLKCQNCVCLPHLWMLPSLETLHIDGMHSLRYVGLELSEKWNADDNSNGSTSYGLPGTTSPSTIIAFPKLKKLKIAYMSGWEEWGEISAMGNAQEDIKIMPCLRCLKLTACDKLRALPHRLLQSAPLKELRIRSCPILLQRYQKITGEDWSRIDHIPKVRIS